MGVIHKDSINSQFTVPSEKYFHVFSLLWRNSLQRYCTKVYTVKAERANWDHIHTGARTTMQQIIHPDADAQQRNTYKTQPKASVHLQPISGTRRKTILQSLTRCKQRSIKTTNKSAVECPKNSGTWNHCLMRSGNTSAVFQPPLQKKEKTGSATAPEVPQKHLNHNKSWWNVSDLRFESFGPVPHLNADNLHEYNVCWLRYIQNRLRG